MKKIDWQCTNLWPGLVAALVVAVVVWLACIKHGIEESEVCLGRVADYSITTGSFLSPDYCVITLVNGKKITMTRFAAVATGARVYVDKYGAYKIYK